MGLREDVAALLAELGGPDSATAACALNSMSQALPLVAEAYYREANPKRRQSLINCLWEYRDIAALPTLRAALRDPDDRVWKEALDGLVVIGGADAQRLLEEERASLRASAREQIRREWIDEAIEQIQTSHHDGSS
jgi:HEAT repeat protein